MNMNMPLDKLNRPVKDLRISLTDRCNFRCTYCMPKEFYGESFKCLPKEELLDFLNSLNNNQFEELRNFFSSMPSIQHKEHYTCPKCGSEEELILSTVEDFFA